MKNLITYFLLCTLSYAIAACSGSNNQKDKEPSRPETGQVVDSTNIKIVMQNFEYFNKHDWAKKASLFADNTIFLDPSYGKEKVTKNRQQMIAKYGDLEKYIPDIRDDIQSIYPSGNTVVVEIISHGTRPDKSDLNLPICIVYRIENGLIVEDHTYYDN